MKQQSDICQLKFPEIYGLILNHYNINEYQNGVVFKNNEIMEDVVTFGSLLPPKNFTVIDKALRLAFHLKNISEIFVGARTESLKRKISLVKHFTKYVNNSDTSLDGLTSLKSIAERIFKPYVNSIWDLEAGISP